MAAVYLSLGSNLGAREENIAAAVAALVKSGVRVLKASSVVETRPYGLAGQPDFLNCALECETELSPPELLAAALRIEAGLGRERRVRWGPRTVDIDIIFYGGEIINSPELTVPHPDMANREFVLGPLCELAPDLAHPVLKLTVCELRRRLAKSQEPARQDK
ncbi:MAG: 2-amino-4-hydroxy-6-hydroxymethyldihydropteridine diphosphokinase [Elusimicrobiales bacterium]